MNRKLLLSIIALLISHRKSTVKMIIQYKYVTTKIFDYEKDNIFLGCNMCKH